MLAANTHHTIHKRYQHNLNQIKGFLQKNNLTIASADKNKAIVVINKDSLEQKVKAFIQENHITHLAKDPTDLFQKQIQQTVHKYGTLMEKSRHQFLLSIKPTAPNLIAYIRV